jgi:hypothetical protein
LAAVTEGGLRGDEEVSQMSLPVCQLSLPGLANSFLAVKASGHVSYVRKKFEFASLPRFLSRGQDGHPGGHVGRHCGLDFSPSMASRTRLCWPTYVMLEKVLAGDWAAAVAATERRSKLG